jgi:hypothetical protein
MCVVVLYKVSHSGGIPVGLTYPHFALSPSLNILLTLMIVVRLILHSKNLRNGMGTSARANGLYKSVVTMLVESSALYTVGFLLFLGPWGAKSAVADIFFPLLSNIQVCVLFAFP